MGTRYHLTLLADPEDHSLPSKAAIKNRVNQLLASLNQQMSTYIPDSEISRFNRYQKTDWFPVSRDFAMVVSTAQVVSKESSGAFDITVAPLIERWGFGARTQFEIPDATEIKAILKDTGFSKLSVRKSPPALKKSNKNIRIDLSAIAKGFAVDKLMLALQDMGFSNGLVEIGGEVRNIGLNQNAKPWRIGVEIPNKAPGQKITASETLLTSNVSMATSGDYRNYFVKDGKRYSHTINPVTGRPVKHDMHSITVVHDSTMLADAYATAFMVMGPEKTRQFVRQNGVRVSFYYGKNGVLGHWQSIDKTKEKWQGEKCQKVGGCTYYNLNP